MKTRIAIENLTKEIPFEEVLPLITPMIKRISLDTNGVYGLEHEDLEQELAFQAYQSWQIWDPDRGTKFSTYVYNALMRRKNFLVRFAKTKRRNNGRSPISLDGTPGVQNEGGTFQLYDILADDGADPETYAYLMEIRDLAEDVLSSMRKNSQTIIRELLDGYTQVEVSKKNGVTQSLVCYHLNSFRRKLREKMELKGYSSFLKGA